MAPAKTLKIVIGAHTPHGTPYVVGSHHLARELKRLGHEVYHIPIPLAPQDLLVEDHLNFRQVRWDGWIRGRGRLSASQDDQFLLWAVPWSIVRFFKIRGALLLTSLAPTFPNLELITAPDILIVDHPKQFWLVDRLKPKQLIYRPTDAYSFPGHKDDAIFRAIEKWLLERSHGVILTASAIKPRMQSLGNDQELPPLLVLENGVDIDAFSSTRVTFPQEFDKIASPRLLYIGTFDNRIDFDFIETAARERPAYSFILGGPLTPKQASRFKSHKNVKVLGPVPYARLFQYMSHCDLGFLPMNDHPFNQTRSPMKLYEFAASGLPMVARATPELQSRNLPFCFLYNDLHGFDAAVTNALSYKSSHRDEMRRLAEERSWPKITSRLLAFCNDVAHPSRL